MHAIYVSSIANCVLSFFYLIVFNVQSIQVSHNGRVDDCFVAMLEAWFKKGSPSWSNMVEALRGPGVEKGTLANDIEEKFINNV